MSEEEDYEVTITLEELDWMNERVRVLKESGYEADFFKKRSNGEISVVFKPIVLSYHN
jgi:hypothetical protein